MPSMKKENLLELLKNDKDVKNEIINIVLKSKQLKVQTVDCEGGNSKWSLLEDLNTQKDNEIRKLKFQIRDKDAEIQEKDSIIEAQKKELAESREKEQDIQKTIKKIENELLKLESEKKSLNGKYISLYGRYGGIECVYEKYLKLGLEIHKQLKNVLNPDESPCNNVELFFGFGIQEGNITALWDLIAANVKYYIEADKLNDMVEIFLYFFSLYQRITYKSISQNIPNVGDVFDERCHTRTSDSNVVGKIEKVILPGFEIGKNINRKSLVTVK